MMDINERQDQTFTSKSNMYVCDNNGRDLYLLGVNVLVIMCLCYIGLQIVDYCQIDMLSFQLKTYTQTFIIKKT